MRLRPLFRSAAAVAVIGPALFALQAVAGGAAYAADAPPVVTSISPNAGPTAGLNYVTFNGTNLDDVTGLEFGDFAAYGITGETSTQFTAEVPPGYEAGPVQITLFYDLNNVTSPYVVPTSYTYEDPPTATTVSPNSGPDAGGNPVTISGTNLAGTTGVTFGGVAATNVTVNSDTSVTVDAPAHAPGAVDVVDVVVRTAGGTATITSGYTYQGAESAPCTTTITGTHSTQLTVSSGLTCLVNAKQSGSVTVAPGASLSVTDSTVSGTVTATSPAAVTYCGSTQNGTLTVTGATGAVVLGNGDSCAADTIPSLVSITGASGAVTVSGLRENGTLTLSGDTGGVTLSASSVNGLVHVENNSGPSVTVAGNTVTGSLYCTGNTPAPTDNGSINTVSGTATSQCAAIAMR